MANPAPPLQSSVDIRLPQGIVLSGIWKLWFSWLYNFVGTMVCYSNITPYTALTGFSYPMGSAQTVLTINPAATIATGTVTLPAAPYDGQPVEIASTNIITSFTLNHVTGQTIKNAPTTLAAGVGVAYYYNAASLTWFRRY
jgi:hypothetical protein